VPGGRGEPRAGVGSIDRVARAPQYQRGALIGQLHDLRWRQQLEIDDRRSKSARGLPEVGVVVAHVQQIVDRPQGLLVERVPAIEHVALELTPSSPALRD
jgi:hypothetical protein